MPKVKQQVLEDRECQSPGQVVRVQVHCPDRRYRPQRRSRRPAEPAPERPWCCSLRPWHSRRRTRSGRRRWSRTGSTGCSHCRSGAHSTVDKTSAERIRSPPMVGVPALARMWLSGPSSRIGWPFFCFLRRNSISRPPEHEAEDQRGQERSACTKGDVAEQVEDVPAIAEFAEEIQHPPAPLPVQRVLPPRAFLSPPQGGRFSTLSSPCT